MMSEKPIIACKRCRVKKLRVRQLLDLLWRSGLKLMPSTSAMMSRKLAKTAPKPGFRVFTLTQDPEGNMHEGQWAHPRTRTQSECSKLISQVMWRIFLQGFNSSMRDYAAQMHRRLASPAFLRHPGNHNPKHIVEMGAWRGKS